MATATQPIIIKRSSGHGGHHGGAWKVAYADFVTAMMALFIVLWLMNSSKQIQEAVGGYFKDPSGKGTMAGTTQAGPPEKSEKPTVQKDNMAKIKEELQTVLRQVNDFDKLKSHIEITVTSEGLRIELMESEKGTFFESGRPEPTAYGREMLIAIANEIGKLPNKISMEGHTDARPYTGMANYSNWELSADRANASRRLMMQNGLREDQVVEVRGFADQRLRNPNNPADAANRRISLIVRYLEGQGPTEAAPVVEKTAKQP
jgi:chemotaxis protein MotB